MNDGSHESPEKVTNQSQRKVVILEAPRRVLPFPRGVVAQNSPTSPTQL